MATTYVPVRGSKVPEQAILRTLQWGERPDVGIASSHLRDAVQRLFDVTVATVALVVCLPLLLVVSVAVALSSPGSVLFVHERVGRRGRPFPCLKFRTMRPDAEAELAGALAADAALAEEFAATYKLRDDPRVTAVGRVLRRTSLDELPQFLNILVGHMSVVGPRPVTVPELGHYGAHVAELLSARPGLTGSWQVSGRSDLTYEQRVALDLAYLRDRRLSTDIKIIARTVLLVLRPGRNGAY